MKELVIYACESSICLTVLWMFYHFVLRNDTRYTRNRFYLLFSMLFSIVAPLLTIRIATPADVSLPDDIVGYLLPEIRIYPSGSPDLSDKKPFDLVPVIYISGAIISALWLISGISRLIAVSATGIKRNRIIHCDDTKSLCFSAFGYIFISRNIDPAWEERMIRHEKKHIAAGHHHDIFLANLTVILQWFNPAAYLMRQSLLEIHEFQVDKRCISDGEDPFSYKQLLVSSVMKTDISLISNTFSNDSLLKKRLTMMTKKKNGRISSLKLIIALPLVILLTVFFSCKKKETQLNLFPEQVASELNQTNGAGSSGSATEDFIYTQVEVMPQFPGGDSALNKFIAKNLSYPPELVEQGIEGKPVISFVIDENGNLSDLTVVISAHPAFDKAACDLLLKSPQWIPGKQGDKPVKVKYSLPFCFRLK